MKQTPHQDEPGASAEHAMNKVLAAEKDARQALEASSSEARTLLQQARSTAERIVQRSDQRITRIHHHCSHAVAAAVSQLQREQQLKVSRFDSAAVDADAVTAVVEKIAELLTTGGPAK
jgi:cell division septum initiation protein DivIVA